MKTSESKAVCRNEIARVVDYILRKATLNQGPKVLEIIRWIYPSLSSIQLRW